MTSGARRAYIDWARGLAVLLMIEAHTLDAWTRMADRATGVYGYATVLGGFAAPMFLWLAGVGVALSATRTAARTASRTAAARAVCERGLEIFLLAFLFRLQAFVLSPGSHPIALFRVDVLNVMGPSIVVAGLVWAFRLRTTGRVALYGALAGLVAMATPIVRAAAWVDHLPLWFQWYVRPAGDLTTFTLFPWSGFVFAGAGAGVLVAAIPSGGAAAIADRGEPARRLHLGLGVAGAALAALGFYAASLPTIYAVPSSFWTSSPTFFAVRVGILMAVFAALFAIPETRALEPLAAMGRASLFIYWIHVELVYGYASWLWRHRLPVWGWAAAFVAFGALMDRAVGWRDRWLGEWRRPPAIRTPAGTSS